MTATLLALPKSLAQLQLDLKPRSISYVQATASRRFTLDLKLPAPPDPSWGTPCDQAILDELLKITNIFRVNHGAGPLKFDPALVACSGWKSMNMAGYKYMDHNTPDPTWPGGRTWLQRMTTYYQGGCAENIAYGFPTAQSVLDAWVSGGPGEGHYENIVNPTWVTIGIGAAMTQNGIIFWTQDFGANPIPAPPDPNDHTPPSKPVNLSATVNGNSVALSWSPSTDNDGVKGYGIYLDAARLGDSFATRTNVGGLSDGTHTIGVDAYDFNSNTSNPATVAVQIGSTPPVQKEPAKNQTWKNNETHRNVVITSVEPYRSTTRVHFKKMNGMSGSLLDASFKAQYTYVIG